MADTLAPTAPAPIDPLTAPLDQLSPEQLAQVALQRIGELPPAMIALLPDSLKMQCGPAMLAAAGLAVVDGAIVSASAAASQQPPAAKAEEQPPMPAGMVIPTAGLTPPKPEQADALQRLLENGPMAPGERELASAAGMAK